MNQATFNFAPKGKRADIAGAGIASSAAKAGVATPASQLRY